MVYTGKCSTGGKYENMKKRNKKRGGLKWEDGWGGGEVGRWGGEEMGRWEGEEEMIE